MDSMIVHAEARLAAWDGAGLTEAAGLVAQHIKGTVGITAQVVAVPPGTLERSVGKVRRVIDRRPKA